MAIDTAPREPLALNPNGTSRPFPLLRRKASNPSLPQISSTETEPSAHASIYDASAHPSADSLVLQNSLAKAADDLAWLQGIDPVHKPHRLDAITEKTSRATLATQRSVAMSGTAGMSTSAASWSDGRGTSPGKGFEGMAWLVGTKQPGIIVTTPSSVQATLGSMEIGATKVPTGHQRSYTTPLPQTRTSRFSEVLSSSDTGDCLVHDVFPKRPHQEPPRRGTTPEGLPTFNTDAAGRYTLPRPPTRLRDYVKRESPRTEHKRQTRHLPPGVVMRGDDGVLVRGKWRAGVSGHLGGEMGRENMHYRSRGRQAHQDRTVSEVRGETRSDLRRILEAIRNLCPCSGSTVEELPAQPVRVRRSGDDFRRVRRGRGRFGGERGPATNF